MGDRKGFSHYKMKDFPWLFPTRKWKEDRYFDKEFRMGIQGRLGGDEGFIPVLRKRMRQKLNDPDLVYAPKLLRNTFITLSRQQLDGRSDKVKHDYQDIATKLYLNLIMIRNLEEQRSKSGETKPLVL